MKVAICSQGKGIDARVDKRFGRCPYFVIIDTHSGEVVESVPNGNIESPGGAGPQSAQLLSGLGVEAVVLGNIGPNAAVALKAAGIQIYTGIEGTVRETFDKFKEGKLKTVVDATVSSHYGMGSGGGRGGGWGRGGAR